MIVKITVAAEADLKQIGEWIAVDDPVRAATFIDQILQKIETLVDAPRGYPLVPRYETSGVRRRVFRDYLIFYRIMEKEIEVLHVLHGARDYEAILFPE